MKKSTLNPFNRHLFFVPNGDNSCYSRAMSALRKVGIPQPTILTGMRNSNGQEGILIMYRCLPFIQDRFIREMTAKVQ